MEIVVLGFDCAACRKAYRLIGDLAAQQGLDIHLSKQSDPQLFVQYQVMTAPGILVDGQLVYQGGCPDSKTILGWLNKTG